MLQHGKSSLYLLSTFLGDRTGDRQSITGVVGYILYRFDVSIRSATVLGLVGAGGLGFSLITTMKMFKYHETAACIIVIILLISAADWISGRLQKRII